MYGLELRNAANLITLDSEIPNYVYAGHFIPIEDRDGKSTAAYSSADRFWDWTHYYSIYSPNGYPLIFMELPASSSGDWVTHVTTKDVGDGYWMVYFAVNHNKAFTTSVRVFMPISPTTPAEGYGLQLRDAANNVTFDASEKSLMLQNVFTSTVQMSTQSANAYFTEAEFGATLKEGSSLTASMSVYAPSPTFAIQYQRTEDMRFYHYGFAQDGAQIKSKLVWTNNWGSIYFPSDTAYFGPCALGADMDIYGIAIDNSRYPLGSSITDAGLPSGYIPIPPSTGTSNIFATFNYQVFQGSQPFPGKWEALPSGASISTSVGTFNIPKVYLFTTFKTNGEYLEISFTAGTGSIDELPNTVTAAIDSGNSVVLTKDRTESGTVIYKVTGPSGWANTLANKGTSPTGVLTAETVSATVTVVFE